MYPLGENWLFQYAQFSLVVLQHKNMSPYKAILAAAKTFFLIPDQQSIAILVSQEKMKLIYQKCVI